MIFNCNQSFTVSICCFAFFVFCSNKSSAGSLYLPLKLSPEIEQRVEQLFVLADMPIIKRPIPIKQVQTALSKLGTDYPELSHGVSRYLERYTGKIGLTHLGGGVSTADGSNFRGFNRRGESIHSTYRLSFSGYWAMSELVAVNLGGVLFDGDRFDKDEFPEGSFISIGTDYLQLDIGNRPHWFGPFQESDMLIATHAPSITSITVSNSIPFEFLGFSYEMFLGEMSESDSILSASRDARITGNPRLFGIHLGFNPITGFAIGFNRLLQYGGGDRDESFSGLYDAFIDAQNNDNIDREGRDFGNQLSSVTTRYTFTEGFPFSVYIEYAGEDTSRSSSFHLGNSALMIGLHLPKLTRNLDFVFEHAEWQNSWYINTNYGDGLSHYGTTLGHWGASQRQTATGAKAVSARLSWAVTDGKDLQFQYRDINNTDDSDKGRYFGLSYSTDYELFIVGVDVLYGQDIFGEDVTRLEGFFRW